MRRYWAEAITSGSFIAIAAWVVFTAIDLPAGAGYFPIFSAVSVIALSAFWFISALMRRTPHLREKLSFDFSYDNFKPLFMLLLTVASIPVIFFLGYFVTTAIYFVVGALLLGVRDWRIVGLTALIMMPLMYGFFILFLGTHLPKGLLM